MRTRLPRLSLRRRGTRERRTTTPRSVVFHAHSHRFGLVAEVKLYRLRARASLCGRSWTDTILVCRATATSTSRRVPLSAFGWIARTSRSVYLLQADERICFDTLTVVERIQEGQHYQLRRLTGDLESFEKEQYDMIRAAFLKYRSAHLLPRTSHSALTLASFECSLQARIGGMDGIFCAYHTTSVIHGFQYISLPEMDEALFGGSAMGEQNFGLSVAILERVFKTATEIYPGCVRTSLSSSFALLNEARTDDQVWSRVST